MEAPGAPRTVAEELERKHLVAAGVLAVVVLAGGLWLRFDRDFAAMLPPMPPKPRPPDARFVRGMDYKPEIYAQYLAQDAARFGVGKTVPEDLTHPFEYELTDSLVRLQPGGKAYETRTLRLSARVDTLEAHSDNGTIRRQHLLLRIENRTDKPLAYRVDTIASGGGRRCLTKGDLEHNALALLPGEAVERTECVYRRGMDLKIERIETMSLPALSYYYVSQLRPSHIGLDARATEGHRAPAGRICDDIPEQAIRLGMEKETVSWRDVVDFYARHRCETYTFPVGYRAFTRKGQLPLPVARSDVAPRGG